MFLTSLLLGVLLGAAALAAGNVIQLGIDTPNGLSVVVSPDSGSILVSRLVPTATSPPTPNPTNPATSTTPLPLANSETNQSSATETPTTSATSLPATTLVAAPATASPVATGVINVTMGSIRELDSNMTEVVATPEHKFNGFAGLNLGVATPPSTPAMTTVPTAIPQVQASCQKIVTALPLNGSTFGVVICAVESNGTTVYDDERNNIAAGQLALAIDLENWPWTQNGAFLELNFTISVPTGRQVSQTSANGVAPVVLGLGVTGSYAVLSTKVTTYTYNTFSALTPGFPLLTRGGDTTTATVTLMFIRDPSTAQHQSFVWSGIIEPGYQPEQKAPGPVAAAADLLPMLIMHVATVALACLIRYIQ